MNEAIRMQLSAFVDGELPENEAELLLLRMCQDADLRREVAEYLALGRLMRSEQGLAGADRLHERVAVELDDEDHPAVEASKVAAESPRSFRPLAGAAVAAAVALVALFALQQNSGVDDAAAVSPVSVADEASGIDAVPSFDAQQERQRQYFLNHTETSSELGANGVNSRVVSLRFSQEIGEDTEELSDVEDNDDDASTETVNQP